MKKFFGPYVKRALLGAAAVFILAETGVRLGGLVDFPLYQRDAQTGYVLTPNQSGVFMQKNHWIFNERSMATGSFRPGAGPNILLLGDSVVVGGNPIDQRERIGSQLTEMELNKWAVWPVGVAGWSAMNEAGYLEKNTDIVPQMQWLVWFLNTGDFYFFTPYDNEVLEPTHHPWSAIWYLFEKYVWYPRLLYHVQKYFPVGPRLDWQSASSQLEKFEEFKTYVKNFGQRYPQVKRLIVWYPMQIEFSPGAPGWPAMTKLITQFCREQGIALLDVSQIPDWSVALYRDAIHPNAAGNRVLAKVIAERIHQAEARVP